MVDRSTRQAKPLAGKTALVTGASSGIGEATAHVLAADGADVAIAARREERLENVATEVRAETDAEVLVHPTDATDSEAVTELVKTTVETLGGLDIAVCNAGLAIDGSVSELTDSEYRKMTAVNVDGMFYTARTCIPHLESAEGNLVFLGSMSGQYPRPHNPVYAATKWWVRGFAISLQASLGEDNVAVTCINPTEVRTEFGSENGAPAEERFDPEAVTEPIEVADAIAFAVRQRLPNAVTELDLYRRDKLSHF